MRARLIAIVALAMLWAPVAHAVEVGAEAPEIGLDDLQGNRIGMQQFRGKVLVLTTWASWCEPCQHELPALQRMYARLRGRGLRVVGVNVDRDEAAARRVVDELGLTFPNVHDARRTTAMRWGATMMPSVFVVGPDGVVRYTHMSYQPGDERELERAVVALLPARERETARQAAAQPETASGSRSESETGTGSEAESETAAGSGAASETAAGSEAESETASGSGAASETATGSGSGSEAGSGSGSGSEAGAGSGEPDGPPPASPSGAGRRGGLCSIGSASSVPLAASAGLVVLALLRRRRSPR